MSSLQKFHRRTMSLGPNGPSDLVTSTATMGDGSGDATHGFYLGGFSDGNKMYVAPSSTESLLWWGSTGIVRGTTLVNNGLANTNTLYSFGSSRTTGHPVAYYCKTLTLGGYNTWYLPAINELVTMYSNQHKTPFATSNGFIGDYYWASTEGSDVQAWWLRMNNGNKAGTLGKTLNYYYRAIRRSTV